MRRNKAQKFVFGAKPGPETGAGDANANQNQMDGAKGQRYTPTSGLIARRQQQHKNGQESPHPSIIPNTKGEGAKETRVTQVTAV